MNRGERRQPVVSDCKIKNIVTSSLIPLTLLTPSIAFAEEAGRVEQYMTGELYERVVHAFEPLI